MQKLVVLPAIAKAWTFVLLFASFIVADSGNTLHVQRYIWSDAEFDGFNSDLVQFLVRDLPAVAPEVAPVGEPAGNAERRAYPESQIVRWGAFVPPQNSFIWRADGSFIVGNVSVNANGSVDLYSDWLNVLGMSLSGVRAIVWQPKFDSITWSKFRAELLAASGDADQVWLKGGERLKGLVTFEKPISGVQASKLTIVSGEVRKSFDLRDVVAVVFSPALQNPLRQQANTLGLKDGTEMRYLSRTITDQSVSFDKNSNWELETLDNPREFARSVCCVVGQTPSVSLLGSIEPVSYKSTSDTFLKWQLGRDRALDGLSLLTNRGTVPHGLAMHSSSQVAYRWSGEAGWFLAEARMGPAPSEDLPQIGSVGCKVVVVRDGQAQTIEQFTLDRIAVESNRNQGERKLKVDLSGVKLLALIVEEGAFGQYGDTVEWLDARLVQGNESSP